MYSGRFVISFRFIDTYSASDQCEIFFNYFTFIKFLQGQERFVADKNTKNGKDDKDEISGRINPFGEQRPWRFLKEVCLRAI